MFKKKTDELFHEISNVIGIADDMLIAGFYELGRPQCSIRQSAKNMQTG